MEINVGKNAGFCPGAEHAIKCTKEELKNRNDKIYCIGEIVHNAPVLRDLEKRGLIVVDDVNEVPDNSYVIFRAHGEPISTYERANEKNLKIIDLTCGLVRIIHDKVEKEKGDSFIIIIGKRKHPEVIGIKGFAGKNSYVIQTENDVSDAYKEFKKTNLNKVYIVSQTTMSIKNFEELIVQIKEKFSNIELIIDNTICNTTEKRQSETRKMAQSFHTMIIIGGKTSANTSELARIANEECKKVYKIESVEEIKGIDFSNISNIGIMAGASTSRENIEEVVEYLKSFD